MSTALAKYLKKLDALPAKIRENYAKIGELDERNKSTKQTLQRDCSFIIEKLAKKGGNATIKRDQARSRYSAALVRCFL